MSMISGQCDKLRELANKLLEHGAFVGFGGTVNTDPLMLDAGTAMIDAAELILELRDDLQRANAAVQEAEHDESMAWDRVRKAEAENAKLREERDMYRDLVDCMVHPDVPDQLAAENDKLRELCGDIYEMAYHEYPSAFEATFADRMRELGVKL